jgi:hypothetical protein
MVNCNHCDVIKLERADQSRYSSYLEICRTILVPSDEGEDSFDGSIAQRGFSAMDA